MRAFIFLALILTSSLAWTKCPDISDAQLNSDQLIVKKLLSSSYKYQSDAVTNQNLSVFTELLKSKFSSASEYLNSAEVSSFIIEQDLENKICPETTFISSEELTTIVSDKIVDTYYGCGCEH